MKPTVLIAVFSAALFGAASTAAAAAYPTTECVSAKQKSLGKLCSSVAKAWSNFEKDPDKDPGGSDRDAAITAATAKLTAGWSKAEDKSEKKNAACDGATSSAAEMSTIVVDAIAAFSVTVTAGLDGNDKSDRKCASKLDKSAGKLCAAILKASSKRLKKTEKDADGSVRDQVIADAVASFAAAHAKTSAKCTGTVPAASTLSDAVEAIYASALDGTVMGSGLTAGVFTEFAYAPGDKVQYGKETLAPVCSRDTGYTMWIKPGTVNKAVVYYQGGGACWDSTTCNFANTFDPDVTAGDNPANIGSGIFDFDDPANPFADWHFVYVSYCTGDVHWGNKKQLYDGQVMQHKGRINAMVAEKLAREHFVDPEQVYVTGISAGSYGALFNAAYLMNDVWPQADFFAVGDAGIGVITQEWLETSFSNWGVAQTLPRFIPALDIDPTTISAPDLYTEIALFFPQHRFGSYQSLYDGSGGGQSAFYNVMKNPTEVSLWTDWWLETCEWSACMQEFVENIASRAPNYRYYTGPGSTHGGVSRDYIYEADQGVGQTYLDWILAGLGDTEEWVDRACPGGSDCDPFGSCRDGANQGLACAVDGDCPGGSCYIDPLPGTLPNDPYQIDGSVVCAPELVCPCDTGSGGVACSDTMLP